MTDTRHLMDLPPGSRTAQPFIEKRVDEIVGRFVSSQEAQRFARHVPPFLRHWLEIGVTALGGYLTIHRKKLPRGIPGDLLWIALNRAIDQAAAQFGETLFGGAGEESAPERKEEAMEKRLALHRSKDKTSIHASHCPDLPPEREAGQGKTGPIPAVKHRWYTLAEAKSVRIINPDGKVSGRFACDSCKDAIAALEQGGVPVVGQSAVTPVAAGNPIFAAIAARIMPGQRESKASELLARFPDLRNELFRKLFLWLTPEERNRVDERLALHLDSEAELKNLAASRNADELRLNLRLIMSKGAVLASEGVEALGLREAETQLNEAADRVRDAGSFFRGLRGRFH